MYNILIKDIHFNPIKYIVPKELYIDSFNFVPLRRDDQHEKEFCQVMNNRIKEIIFVTSFDQTEICFNHEKIIHSDFSNYIPSRNRFNLSAYIGMNNDNYQEPFKYHFKIK